MPEFYKMSPHQRENRLSRCARAIRAFMEAGGQDYDAIVSHVLSDGFTRQEIDVAANRLLRYGVARIKALELVKHGGLK